MVRITILSDNSVAKKHMKAEWGFSALVEVNKYKILFDTGADSAVVVDNLKELDISIAGINSIFISHAHWDHTGGLNDLQKLKECNVYIPYNWEGDGLLKNMIKISAKIEIFKNIFSTGTLDEIEQSLVIKTRKGTVIIAGCSHPGVEKIMNVASEFGKPYALIGGLHDFDNFDVVKGLKYICPTHCTKHKDKIKKLYEDKYIEGGAGAVIKIV